MRRGSPRTWSLSLRPTGIALGIAILFLLTDSALAIVFGARTSSLRREATRLRSRLDSLETQQEILARRLLVRDALIDAADGRLPRSEATLLAEEIDRNATLYRFDPLLILAVVLTESRGSSDAVGRLSSGTASGALGVMQVQPATARQTAERLGLNVSDSADLFDPAFNLRVGVAYLLQMVHRYRDLRLGIMAYNVGASGLESALRGETSLPEDYYRKVFVHYRHLRSLRRTASSASDPIAPPPSSRPLLDADRA